MKNGVVYSTSFPRENVLPHQYGTHSAPWFLRGAIQTSKYYTRVRCYRAIVRGELQQIKIIATAFCFEAVTAKFAYIASTQSLLCLTLQ